MRRMKVLSSIVLTFFMLVNICFTVSAQENASDGDCISKKTYECEYDLDQLLNMAFKQRNQGTTFTKYNQGQPLEVIQMIEERIYSDGTIEQDYSKTTFPVMEDVKNLSAEYYKEAMDSKYGVMAAVRGNYTVRLVDGISMPEASLRNVVVTVQNTGTTPNASNGIIYSKVQNSVTSTGFTCQPHFNPQSFTHSVNSLFFVPNGQFAGDGQMYFYADIYTADGHTFQVLQQITKDDY